MPIVASASGLRDITQWGLKVFRNVTAEPAALTAMSFNNYLSGTQTGSSVIRPQILSCLSWAHCDSVIAFCFFLNGHPDTRFRST